MGLTGSGLIRKKERKNFLLILLIVSLLIIAYKLSADPNIPTELSSYPSPSIRDQMEAKLRQRVHHMRQRCHEIGLERRPLLHPISAITTLDRKGIMSVCLAPKAGLSSWSLLGLQLNDIAIERRASELPSVLSVRHPLTRLAACYRDKFLDGLPIISFLKNNASTVETFRYMWHAFWLPALISKNEVYIEPLKEAMKREPRPADSTPSYKLMPALMKKAYGHKEALLIKRFARCAFTFTDFVRHVLWTHDLGLHSPLWTPISTLCQPCERRYDYMVHLESAKEEVRYLLQRANYPESTTLPHHHRSQNASTTYNLYAGLAPHFMQRILQLYWMDFDLFGYAKEDILTLE